MLQVSEVAQRLNVSERTVRRWVRQGVLPGTQRADHYIFDEARLEAWAEARGIPWGLPIIASSSVDESDLVQAMRLGGIHAEVQAGSQQELFEEVERRMVLPPHPGVSLVGELLQRELIASTALGRGVAIPHPQHHAPWIGVQPQVGTFFLAKPLDFGALDGLPVQIAFVLLCAETTTHLKLLSQLAQILRNDSIVQYLQAQPSAEELLARFQSLLAS